MGMIMSKKAMTRLLHAILCIGALIAAGIFFGAVPLYGQYMAQTAAPEFAYAYVPCLLWAWAFALPLFLAVIPAWRVVSSISDTRGAFCRANVRALRQIAYLAFADGVIFPLGMLIVAFMGAGAPGLTVLVTPAVIFACAAAGIAALCLSCLVAEAAALREENDLTI